MTSLLVLRLLSFRPLPKPQGAFFCRKDHREKNRRISPCRRVRHLGIRGLQHAHLRRQREDRDVYDLLFWKQLHNELLLICDLEVSARALKRHP